MSPQNIVVTFDGGVKLVDFGIAKASMNASKTESQVIKGKLAYMAPEQANPPDGAPVDRRADIFAMGIVLWECLAGRRLATGDARAVMSKIIDMEFQAPSALNPDVPAELDAITRRALERSPGDRYQTAQAMRDALERFLRTQGEMVSETVIGGLVSELFSREREDLQRQIRVQMQVDGSSVDLKVEEKEESRKNKLRASSERGSASSPSGKRDRLEDIVASSPAVPGSPTESVGSLRVVRTSVRSASESRSARTLGVLGASAAALVALGALFLPRPAGMSTGSKGDRSPPAGAQPPAPSPPPPLEAPMGPERDVASGVAPATESNAGATPNDAGGPPQSAPPSRAGRMLGAPRTLPPARGVPSTPSKPKLDKDPWR